MIVSGPPKPDMPYRYGCSCGATWNSPYPINNSVRGLCSLSCHPNLTRLNDESPQTEH